MNIFSGKQIKFIRQILAIIPMLLIGYFLWINFAIFVLPASDFYSIGRHIELGQDSLVNIGDTTLSIKRGPVLTSKHWENETKIRTFLKNKYEEAGIDLAYSMKVQEHGISVMILMILCFTLIIRLVILLLINDLKISYGNTKHRTYIAQNTNEKYVLKDLITNDDDEFDVLKALVKNDATPKNHIIKRYHRVAEYVTGFNGKISKFKKAEKLHNILKEYVNNK